MQFAHAYTHAYTHETFQMHMQLEKWFESEFLPQKLKQQRFFVKVTLNWLTVVKTYGGKRSSQMVDDNVSDADRDTA